MRPDEQRADATSPRPVRYMSDLVKLAQTRALPTRVVVDGELSDPRGPRFVDMILPTQAEPTAQLFESVTISTGSPHHLPLDTTSRALVTGNLDIAHEGSLIIKSATIAAHAEAGAYTSWCKRQHHGLHLRPASRESSFVTAQRVVDELRTSDPALKMTWLGTSTTRAFSDVHRGDDDLRNGFIVAGAPMQGPNAVEQMCVHLRQADPSTTYLVVIARGGGGIHELAIFNDRRLLTAARDCLVPTLCAVGHHTDFPLLERACTWRLSVPSDVRMVAQPLILGLPTAQERKAARAQEAAAAVQQIQALQVERDQLQREHDLANSQARATSTGIVATETAMRLARRDHLVAIGLAVAIAFASVVAILGIPWLWPTISFTVTTILTVTALAAVLCWLNPKRLGRQPWISWKPPPDIVATYHAARTVDAYNRARAAHLHQKGRLSRDNAQQRPG